MSRPADELITLLRHSSSSLSAVLAGTFPLPLPPQQQQQQQQQQLRGVDAMVEIAAQKIRQLKRSAVGEADSGAAIAEAERLLDELRTRLARVQGSRYYEGD